ncbi:MAG: DUF493 domain-containing protein [Succinivibrio sp.]|nr:DUF493 domain-containing protein [Succinivibrio sp.]
MTDAFKTFREVLIFPCQLEFKVIVTALNPEALNEVQSCIRRIEPEGLLPLVKPPRASKKQSYLSYTVPVKISSAENLERIYREVAALDCVLHVL